MLIYVPESLWLAGVQHECRARWERVGTEGSPAAALVSIGTIDGGRWYVAVMHRGYEARGYPDEQSARQVAQAWRDHIGGNWRHIPCHGFWWAPWERR